MTSMYFGREIYLGLLRQRVPTMGMTLVVVGLLDLPLGAPAAIIQEAVRGEILCVHTFTSRMRRIV